MPFQIKPLYKHTFKVLHCTIYFSVPKPTYKTSERSIKTPLPKSGDKDDDGNRDSDKQKATPLPKSSDKDDDSSDDSDKQKATPLPKSSNKDDDSSGASDKQNATPSLKSNDDDDNGDETNKQDTLLSSKTSEQVIIESSQ